MLDWRLNILIYQRYFILLPITTFIFAILSFPGRESAENIQFMLLTYGEVLLPPFTGWIATRLLLGDPYREMLFCSPLPVWNILIKRLTILFFITFFSWGILLLFFAPSLSPAMSTWKIFLGGLSTNLIFISIGTWGAIRFCSATSGVIVVISVWAGSLLLNSTLLLLPFGYVIHPFLTLKAPDSGLWVINLTTLFFITCLLLFFSYRLIENEERLLPRGDVEEIV